MCYLCFLYFNFILSNGQKIEHAGLGLNTKQNEFEKSDDEFTMYRKRMMLAYKFRPNPMVGYSYSYYYV